MINKIMYICDRRACETCHDECTLTADIQHARNFEKSGGYFIETATLKKQKTVSTAERCIYLSYIENFENEHAQPPIDYAQAEIANPHLAEK